MKPGSGGSRRSNGAEWHRLLDGLAFLRRRHSPIPG